MLPNLSRRHPPISALHNRLKGFRDPQNRPLNSGVLAGIYCVYSATVEERYLIKQFPDTYPMYSRSTKMLVPLIF